MSGSITIQGVPASISRRQVQDFLIGLGIDPNEVCGLTFYPMGVEIEVYASDQRGRYTHDGKDVATHRIMIPVIEEEPAT